MQKTAQGFPTSWISLNPQDSLGSFTHEEEWEHGGTWEWEHGGLGNQLLLDKSRVESAGNPHFFSSFGGS